MTSLKKTVFPKHVRFTALPVIYSFYSLKNQLCTLIPSDILDSSDHGRGYTLVCELLYHACIPLGYGGDSE